MWHLKVLASLKAKCFQICVSINFLVILDCVSNLPVLLAAAIPMNIWIEFSNVGLLQYITKCFTTLKHVCNAAYLYFVLLRMYIIHLSPRHGFLKNIRPATIRTPWISSVFDKSNEKSETLRKHLQQDCHHNITAIHRLHQCSANCGPFIIIIEPRNTFCCGPRSM